MKVPAIQDVQTVADVVEYFPTAQPPVTADSPVVAQYEPAVQDVHVLNPANAPKDPVKQEEQTEAEVAEYLPARQFTQLAEVVTPVVVKYLPAAQLLQLVEPVEDW